MVKLSTGQIEPVWFTVIFLDDGTQTHLAHTDYTTALTKHNDDISQNNSCALLYMVDAKKQKMQVFNRFYKKI